MPAAAGGRALVLSLFRSFIREARQMPTRSRRDYIIRKVHADIAEQRQVTDPEQLRFHVELLQLQLDNVARQRQHLNELAKQGNLKGPK